MTVLKSEACPDAACSACLQEQRRELTRRSFMTSFLGAATALIAAVIGLPLARFVLYPLQGSAADSDWTELGETSNFERLSTPVLQAIPVAQRDGWRQTVNEQLVYISRTSGGELQVLSAVCPHLGCSVAWHDAQTKFVCPCHGGTFDAHGQHLSGPPPRGMDRLDSRVVDGKLQVQFAWFRSNIPQKQLLS